MFIILPDEIDGLAYVEKNLEKVTTDQLLRGTQRDVNVYLPKFKIESNIPLETPLSKVSNFFTSRRFFARFSFSSITKQVSFHLYPSRFLYIILPQINSLLAISKVITIGITLFKFKSNFLLGLFSCFYAVPSIPVVFQYFGIKFQ